MVSREGSASTSSVDMLRSRLLWVVIVHNTVTRHRCAQKFSGKNWSSESKVKKTFKKCDSTQLVGFFDGFFTCCMRQPEAITVRR